MRFWDKNKPQRDMYAFLQINGYVKFRPFPVKDYIGTDGNKHIITRKEQEDLQQQAGERTLKMLQSAQEDLQDLANSDNQKFIDIVDEIITKSHKDAYKAFLKSKGFEMKKEKEVDYSKEELEHDIEYKIKEKAGFYEE